MKAKPPFTAGNSLRKKFPESSERLALFDAIQKAVYSIPFEPPRKIPDGEARTLLLSVRPLLDGARLDENAFEKSLLKLFGALRKKSPGEFPETKEIPDSLLADYLVADAETLREHAGNLGVSSAVLVSSCQQAARPQLTEFIRANSGIDTSEWRGGHCPYCGSLPSFANIENSGLRRLFCPNCLASYTFSRHHCPSCGSGGLNVLAMEAWPGLLLESCRSCAACLKTWSYGRGEPPCPFPLIDIVTWKVDEAAEMQGLKRMSLGVLGV